MRLSISHYHGSRELSYRTFPVTPEGLTAAGELLAARTVNGYRHGVSPWQFDDPYGGDLNAAARLLEAGDAAGLGRLLREHAPRV